MPVIALARMNALAAIAGALTACCIASPARVEAGVSEALVGHWSFDDCTPSDSSGNGHHGTTHGDPSCVEGISGNAFEFDGAQDYVTVDDTSVGNLGSEATIAFWVNVDANGGCTRIFEKDDHSFWWFDTCDGLNFDVNQYPLWNSSRRRLFGPEQFGAWQFVAVVKLEGTYDLYVNGNLVHSMVTDERVVANGIELTFGRSQYWRHSYFRGSIDEARVYNRALRASEIAVLATPIAEPCAGDCDMNGGVTIGELITSVRIALGTISISQCAAVDTNGDGLAAISELIVSINALLTGCAPTTPTVTPTATPVPATATPPGMSRSLLKLRA